MSCYLKPKQRQRKSHTLQKKMLKFEANVNSPYIVVSLPKGQIIE